MYNNHRHRRTDATTKRAQPQRKVEFITTQSKNFRTVAFYYNKIVHSNPTSYKCFSRKSTLIFLDNALHDLDFVGAAISKTTWALFLLCRSQCPTWKLNINNEIGRGTFISTGVLIPKPSCLNSYKISCRQHSKNRD